MTVPEIIRKWVEREFNPKHVEKVYAGFIDVATGNRPGSPFERDALARILPVPEGYEESGEGPWQRFRDAEDFGQAEVGVSYVIRYQRGAYRIYTAPYPMD